MPAAGGGGEGEVEKGGGGVGGGGGAKGGEAATNGASHLHLPPSVLGLPSPLIPVTYGGDRQQYDQQLQLQHVSIMLSVSTCAAMA